MQIDPTETVANIALRLPTATRTFERFGIDFGCRGKVPLVAACSHLKLPLREVLHDLELHADAPAQPAVPPGDARSLVRYVVDRHHVHTRSELARLTTLASAVASAEEACDGALAGTLREVERLVRALKADLVPHMAKEEQLLFPYVEELAEGRAPTPHFRTIHAPLQVMRAEHDEVSGLLGKLKRVTGSYAAPRDAGASQRALYAGLAELAHDVHVHVHLENNVLFPLAQRLEQLARGT